jgi:hypothetical protein
MRTIAAVGLFTLLTVVGSADPLKPAERQRLIAHLEMTEAWLDDELRGLSQAQQTYRPAKGAWSILDVVDHLAVAEPQYWQTLKDSMKNPAPPADSGVSEAGILWYGIDRTQRNRTAEAREPKGQFADTPKAFASFRKLRKEMLEYARSTGDDLRAHRYLDSKMDLYQWFVMISAHSQRHILQIREIKAGPGFPKQ